LGGGLTGRLIKKPNWEKRKVARGESSSILPGAVDEDKNLRGCGTPKHVAAQSERKQKRTKKKKAGLQGPQA